MASFRLSFAILPFLNPSWLSLPCLQSLLNSLSHFCYCVYQVHRNQIVARVQEWTEETFEDFWNPNTLECHILQAFVSEEVPFKWKIKQFCSEYYPQEILWNGGGALPQDRCMLGTLLFSQDDLRKVGQRGNLRLHVIMPQENRYLKPNYRFLQLQHIGGRESSACLTFYPMWN